MTIVDPTLLASGHGIDGKHSLGQHGFSAGAHGRRAQTLLLLLPKDLEHRQAAENDKQMKEGEAG